jgi:hypothetical protein
VYAQLINAQEGRKRGQSWIYGRFGTVAPVRISDVVALDHSIERLSVNGKNTCCRLLVSAGAIEYAGNIPTFDFR